MIALGIDTSSSRASVGVASSDGALHAVLGLDSGVTHSERLLPAVRALLDVSGLSFQRIDLFAVTSGPGSFTGLRIGMAAAKGMALAAGRPLVGLSTLETIAAALGAEAAADGPAPLVCVLMDAGRGEVYRGLYRLTSGEPAAEAPEAALRPGAAALLPGPAVICGSGFHAHRRAIEPLLPAGCIVVQAPAFLAGALARRGLGLAAPGRALPPLAPNYLRASDAEKAWRD
ncbi:MAG TPA: tRNA (adenosine(37)-N6)-threonylcarbamoyltransferase complex dimerization subunit type 1 TsaB [Candidatus Polarisedimenticolia bacterium]|nr:tRNA (adenosine(37)-N6)-threonylcarbamoyltransferase complex dimerization subunit type 1 TsaB [Candidatus Polarisedimenticolia bacterium]